VYRIAS